MLHHRRALCALGAALVLAFLSGSTPAAQRDNGEGKPSLSLRLTPPVGFSPLRVRVTVDVRGGAEDFQDFYCPTVEWDWGNGTVSENSEDCGPYEPGVSTIRRRFTAEHLFREGGAYKIVFRLKQRNKVVATASGNVQVRAGAREGFEN